jgi:hypothetical protein
MFSHKVLRSKDIFCGIYKKTKNGHVNSNVGAPKFVFFTEATKNVLFLQNFMNELKMSRCISRYFFQNFQIFWNMFFGNGCIYTREPKWISPYVHTFFFANRTLALKEITNSTKHPKNLMFILERYWLSILKKVKLIYRPHLIFDISLIKRRCVWYVRTYVGRFEFVTRFDTIYRLMPPLINWPVRFTFSPPCRLFF